ncbi:acyl-CoA dehydrogenase/oxidase [Mycena vitilis]|nr:acyl-CoA dehydrogenase/oxidase [Mycena vitilis]
MATHQIRLMNEARARASFDSEELTKYHIRRAKTVKRREAAFARIRVEQLPDTYGELKYDNGHNVFDFTTPRHWLTNASPFGLHIALFIPALKLLASPKQQAYWLPLAESCRILGTYCQTELGHGSFVRGLETTATFDAQTDESVLHSPTASSTKYWPGGLGYSASHAIVMARLVVVGTDHGVHPLIVQLRSLDDYAPLPGIELGDIGLKLGLKSSDNGYAVFTRVRIPRAAILAATHGTDAARAKLAYGTMLVGRRAIVGHAHWQLAQATTIALRYSVVREQSVLPGSSAHGAAEVPLLAFRAQNQRLLTLMTLSFALLLAARDVHSDVEALATIHATLAGLKACATQTFADGVEDARKCCGGHGYLAMAGFMHLGTTATSMATIEGENYVMYQQTARFLIKSAEGGGHDANVGYLRDGMNGETLGSNVDLLDPDVQLGIFRHRAVRLVGRYAEVLRVSKTCDGLDPALAWNTHMVGLISAARAHVEYAVLRSFVEAVQLVETGPTRMVLQRLCSLFALTCIDGSHGMGFVEDGHLSSQHLREIHTAVALTDAWNFSDASLDSALGCRDGNVYERTMSWTRKVPLNSRIACLSWKRWKRLATQWRFQTYFPQLQACARSI